MKVVLSVLPQPLVQMLLSQRSIITERFAFFHVNGYKHVAKYLR